MDRTAVIERDVRGDGRVIDRELGLVIADPAIISSLPMIRKPPPSKALLLSMVVPVIVTLPLSASSKPPPL